MRIHTMAGANRFPRLMMLAALVSVLLLITGAVSARQYKIVERVSVSTEGVETKNASRPVINGDGTIVAFWTDTGALVPNDTNFAGDIFVRNRTNNVTERISLGFGGVQTARTDTNPPHSYPDIGISDSGTIVAYATDATNIRDANHALDTNGVTDVYVVDRSLGATDPNRTKHVSFGSAGNPQANGGSFNPTISGNGQFVVYRSVANSIVAGDSNNVPDIFIYDRAVNANARVNLSSGGAQANNEDGASDFTVNDDGRYVAFESVATNLVASDFNGRRDIFIRDRQTNSTCRISLAPGGFEANGDSIEPFISGDGTYVVFSSTATNLVSGDTNGHADIFIWVRESAGSCIGTISRVNLSSEGAQANGGSSRPVVSDTGRYVSYWSVGANLVDGDTNGQPDFFLFDRTTEITTRVNVSANYTQSNGFQNQFSAMSDDGRVVAYESFGSNLVAGDSNASSDVFVAEGGPSSPHDLVMSARTETSITLTWTDSTGGSGSLQETNMVVQRRPIGGSFKNWATLAANTTTYTDTGNASTPLAACQAFQYRVIAQRDYGGKLGLVRSGSNVILGKTLGCPPGPFNVNDPLNGETIINVERAIFEWGLSEEASTFTVTINRTAGGTLGTVYNQTLNVGDVCNASACSMTPDSSLLAELAVNGTYTWTVVANNSKGSTGNNNPTAGSATPTTITFYANSTGQPRNFDLLGPIDNLLVRSPSDYGGLKWRDNRDADTYNLSIIQISRNTRLGTIISETGLTWESDSDALTCDGTTRICTYALDSSEIALLETGTYAWTVTAFSPSGTPREARNGAGKFSVRTTDIQLLYNRSFENMSGTNVKRASNWTVGGSMSGDRRLCFAATGTAPDGLCVWKFAGSATENAQIYQELNDEIGLLFGDQVVLTGFAETIGTTKGKLTIKLTITYVNPATAPTTATITIPNGTSTGYTDLPDVISTIQGPVSKIRVTILSKIKDGVVNLDNISLLLLADSDRALQPLPDLGITTPTLREGVDALPLPEAPDGFRDNN